MYASLTIATSECSEDFYAVLMPLLSKNATIGQCHFQLEGGDAYSLPLIANIQVRPLVMTLLNGEDLLETKQILFGEIVSDALLYVVHVLTIRIYIYSHTVNQLKDVWKLKTRMLSSCR